MIIPIDCKRCEMPIGIIEEVRRAKIHHTWMCVLCEKKYRVAFCSNSKCAAPIFYPKELNVEGGLCADCRSKKRTCSECGVVYFNLYSNKHCSEKCEDKFDNKLKEERAHKYWCSLPCKMRETVPELVPDQASLQKVMKWQDLGGDQKPIQFSFGMTRTGKTRSNILRCREFAKDGYDIIRVKGPEFKRNVIELSWGRECQGFERLSEYVDHLTGYDTVVWFEEIDKLKFSETVEDHFFEILDTRIERDLPTIFTCKCDLLALCKKMSAEDGDQIMGRFLDSAFAIKFTKPKTALPRTDKSLVQANNHEHKNTTATNHPVQ